MHYVYDKKYLLSAVRDKINIQLYLLLPEYCTRGDEVAQGFVERNCKELSFSDKQRAAAFFSYCEYRQTMEAGDTC